MRLAVVTLLVVSPALGFAQPAPSRAPTAAPSRAPTAPPPPAPVVTPPAVRARLTRATVNVLDGSTTRARGVVMANTGAVFTALDAIDGARDLRVQYPDGRTARARVQVTDTAWGVALLAPLGPRWPEGLLLSTSDGRTRDPVSWVPAAGARPSGGTLRRRRSFVGGDATLLRDAWEIDPVPANGSVGSAVYHHATNTVVGVMVPPIRDQEITGAPYAFAAPASVLRGLVARVEAAGQPWIGLTMSEIPPGMGVIAAEGGLRVVTVHPEGPGASSGLRAGDHGDVVTAIDGHPVRTLEDLGLVLQGRRPGETVTLQVVRGGARIEVPLVLGTRPAE